MCTALLDRELCQSLSFFSTSEFLIVFSLWEVSREKSALRRQSIAVAYSYNTIRGCTDIQVLCSIVFRALGNLVSLGFGSKVGARKPHPLTQSTAFVKFVTRKLNLPFRGAEHHLAFRWLRACTQVRSNIRYQKKYLV